MTKNNTGTGYYAVIFTSKMTGNWSEYLAMAERIEQLVKRQSGYLGHETYREQGGNGVTISYWDSLENIKKWKEHWEHREAQELGQKKFYAHYRIRIAQVVEDYEFTLKAKQQ